MLAGSTNHFENYSFYPDALKTAITYLKNNDLSKKAPGIYDLDIEGARIIIMELNTKPREECLPEIHGKFLDIQYLIFGKEQIAYYPEDGKSEIYEDFMEDKDIILYKNNPNRVETRINMEEGMYAIFFPWDVHVPAIVVEKPILIGKAVIKIPIDSILK